MQAEDLSNQEKEKLFNIFIPMHYRFLFYNYEPTNREIDYNEYFNIEFSKSLFLNMVKDKLKKNTLIKESTCDKLDIE